MMSVMVLELKQRIWQWQTLCVLAAIYLPNLVGFAFGAGHCDTCRWAWLWAVWILPAGVIQEITRDLSNLRLSPDGMMFVSALLVQAVWIVGWCWLATLGRWSFWGVLAATLAASAYSAVVVNAVIRM